MRSLFSLISASCLTAALVSCSQGNSAGDGESSKTKGRPFTEGKSGDGVGSGEMELQRTCSFKQTIGGKPFEFCMEFFMASGVDGNFDALDTAVQMYEKDATECRKGACPVQGLTRAPLHPYYCDVSMSDAYKVIQRYYEGENFDAADQSRRCDQAMNGEWKKAGPESKTVGSDRLGRAYDNGDPYGIDKKLKTAQASNMTKAWNGKRIAFFAESKAGGVTNCIYFSTEDDQCIVGKGSGKSAVKYEGKGSCRIGADPDFLAVYCKTSDGEPCDGSDYLSVSDLMVTNALADKPIFTTIKSKYVIPPSNVEGGYEMFGDKEIRIGADACEITGQP